jgi:hypothetical protein
MIAVYSLDAPEPDYIAKTGYDPVATTILSAWLNARLALMAKI